MAAPTLAQFRILFPAFVDEPDAYVEAWMGQFSDRFTPACFRRQWAMAVYRFAAHHMALNPSDGSGASEARGAITAESVIDTSRSYGANVELAKVPPSLQEFTSTVHGLVLIGIILSRDKARARVIKTGTSRVGVNPWRR